MQNQRGGQPMDMLFAGGIGNKSKSIRRCPPDISAVRMKSLSLFGVDNKEYYGDLMTWDEFQTVNLPHGTKAFVRFPRLQSGWRYEYDALRQVFTVTEASGKQTRLNILTFSDLGIVWDVLSSHQFRVYFLTITVQAPHLIAWRKKKGCVYDEAGNILWPYPKGDNALIPGVKDNAITKEAWMLAYVDQFFSDRPLHWHCNRGIRRDAEQPELKNQLVQTITEAKIDDILRSNVPPRHATGNYADMAIHSPDEKRASIDKRRNAAMNFTLGEFQMIACFATLMHMSKPVYEPWMLWGLWKWVNDGGDPEETTEKIFDLSPNWGG